MTDASDRLGYVLDGVSFPVARWELIALAEHYGADATTLHDLRALSDGRYASLTEVVNAIAEKRQKNLLCDIFGHRGRPAHV